MVFDSYRFNEIPSNGLCWRLVTSNFFAVEQAEVQFLSFGPNHGSPLPPCIGYLLLQQSTCSSHSTPPLPQRPTAGIGVIRSPPLALTTVCWRNARLASISPFVLRRACRTRALTPLTTAPPAALAPCTKLHSAGSTGPRSQHSHRNSKVLIRFLTETNSLWSIVWYGIEPTQQPLSWDNPQDRVRKSTSPLAISYW